jgi:hypothetical protein
MRKFPLLDIYVYMNASGGEFRRLQEEKKNSAAVFLIG